MSDSFALAYLVWITVVVAAAALLRTWYCADRRRSQLVFWVVLTLACPLLALGAYLLLKMLRVQITFGAHANASAREPRNG